MSFSSDMGKIVAEQKRERGIATYDRSVLQLISKTLPDYDITDCKSLDDLFDTGWPLFMFVEPVMQPDTTMSVLFKNPQKLHLMPKLAKMIGDSDRLVGVLFPIKGVSKHVIIHNCEASYYGSTLHMIYKGKKYYCQLLVEFLKDLF